MYVYCALRTTYEIGGSAFFFSSSDYPISPGLGHLIWVFCVPLFLWKEKSYPIRFWAQRAPPVQLGSDDYFRLEPLNVHPSLLLPQLTTSSRVLFCNQSRLLWYRLHFHISDLIGSPQPACKKASDLPHSWQENWGLKKNVWFVIVIGTLWVHSACVL